MLEQSKETNPLCYDRDLFCERVEHSMAIAGISWDQLVERFSEAGYEISIANLKTYIYQRNASLKLVLCLSKALNASIDYLLGNVITASPIMNGFDKDFSGSRYKQFNSSYYVYYYPTRTNTPEELIVATLKIKGSDGYSVEFTIPINEDGAAKTKKYQGHLILSKKTHNGFITLYGENGELVSLAFNDPNTFQYKYTFGIAALLSISSGDGKRSPTLSRAVISSKRLTEKMVEIAKANLRLNSKYITITQANMDATIDAFFAEEGLPEVEDVKARLKAAFKPRVYSSIEESYFLNTFKLENNLTDIQAETLVAKMREASVEAINNKVPRNLESRLFMTFKDSGMFEDDNKS